jgi:hypothetical protein
VVRITGSVSMPIASDPNPVFDGGSFRPQVGWTTNSPAHNGRGQNVLFDDGSSRFLKSPVFGAHADNIWRAEDVDKYSGTEAQASATDAFLTP